MPKASAKPLIDRIRELGNDSEYHLSGLGLNDVIAELEKEKAWLDMEIEKIDFPMTYTDYIERKVPVRLIVLKEVRRRQRDE